MADNRAWPFDPMEGQALEFWTHCMSLEGSGIPGYFKGSHFWSHDGADAYAPGEVQRWSYARGLYWREYGWREEQVIATYPRGPRGTWTAQQWEQIVYLARVASGAIQTGCVPRTAMKSLREFAKGAVGVSASSGNTKPPSDADGQPLEPSEALRASSTAKETK